MDLKKYIIGEVNETMRIQMLIPWWQTVGSGKYSTLTSNEVVFQGSYDYIGYKGTYNLKLTVLDDKKAFLVLNGTELNCTYDESANTLRLHIASGPYAGTMLIEIWENGTWIDPGYRGSYHVWIGK